MLHMPHWLVQCAALTPHREALVYEGKRWTFSTLNQDVCALAHRLQLEGIAAHSRIGLLMAASPAYVTCVHALSRLQAMVFPLNTRLTAAELSWQVQNGEVTLLVIDSTQQAMATAIEGTVPNLKVVTVESVPQPTKEQPQAHTLGDTIDLAAPFGVIYTSGTTGTPKGAVITYGNIWWNAIGSSLNLGNYTNDRWLACMPLFHVGGLSILWRSVIYGIPVHLHTRFDPHAVNQAIDHDNITIISVVSNMLQRMLVQRDYQPYPKSLRCVLIGGGPVPTPLLQVCNRLQVPLVQTYGLTETASQAATLAPEDAPIKVGSAGKPLFTNELRIVTDGTSTTVGAVGEISEVGAVGEILVRGPAVVPGYLQPGEATLLPATDNEGWLHTGDLGYLDADGYLFVVDRRSDLVISGGENVYPAEVEAVLLAHPAVAEAGVSGVSHSQWGQVPAAAVVVKHGCNVTADELVAFCSERLAAYKVPAHIKFVASLPRTASGKLQRRLLDL